MVSPESNVISNLTEHWALLSISQVFSNSGLFPKIYGAVQTFSRSLVPPSLPLPIPLLLAYPTEELTPTSQEKE